MLESDGRLIGIAAFAQLMAGAGGGPALKETIPVDPVEPAIVAIGARLDWHGAISFDYVRTAAGPRFVDCNPRLVEPMTAHFAAADLTGLVLAISRGERVDATVRARPGIRTRLALQALLGIRVRLTGAAIDTRPLLIVANHSSWLDISVITSLAPVVFVAKAEIALFLVGLAVLAVVLRPMGPEMQALIVQRAQQPNAGRWGFPGGVLELGETVFEGAMRELHEETGIVAEASTRS